MITETNERIDKSIPPEVVAAMFALLKQYGVPVHHRITWMYAQKALLARLMAAYREQQGSNQ